MTRFPALAVALDVADLPAAVTLARAVAEHSDVFKVGLELLAADSRGAVEAVAALGPAVFCDAKLCDIPRTVEAAARSLARMPVEYITVHTDGGPAMLHAAVEGAAAGAAATGRDRPKVLGVTVLTSLDRDALAATGCMDEPETLVERRARLAAECGLDGVVCAAPDLGRVRTAAGDLLLVTPGIRPQGHRPGSDDQARVATAGAALAAGTDMVVVGRPITAAAEPAKAAAAFAAEVVAYRDQRR